MRKYLALLIALLLTLSLASVATAEVDPSTLDFVTIDWYIGSTPPADITPVQDAVNEILKEKFNCNVNIIYMPTAEWETNMTTMVSSGQDLGIIGFGSQSKLDYVVQSQRGAFYPLNDLLEEYGQGTLALFNEGVWDAMKIGGNIYGIPSLKDNGYYISLIYNAEMAEALGITEDEMKHDNFRDLEELFYKVKELRDEKMPEYADHPVCWNNNLIYPYNFAFETFLNDSYLGVCNIEGAMDLAGYDCETVVNFYDTPEFLDYCLQKQKMVEDGIYAYDYENLTDMYYDGGVFAYIGWGYTYMQEHLMGDAFTTKMVMADTLWTDTNNFFSAGTAISANCADPARAMMILNEVNTNPDFATLMRFGVEGIHYVITEDGDMSFEGTLNEDPTNRAYHYWYNAPVGNLTIVRAPSSYVGPDSIMLTKMVEYNNSCLQPNHLGFVFDTTPVVNEIAACCSIVQEYQVELAAGQVDSPEGVEELVAEFREKLHANGVDAIVAEIQRQIDEWKAAK